MNKAPEDAPAREHIQKSLREIDENIELLNCVHFTMNGSEQVTDGMIEALGTIHKRLRRECDTLLVVLSSSAPANEMPPAR